MYVYICISIYIYIYVYMPRLMALSAECLRKACHTVRYSHVPEIWLSPTKHFVLFSVLWPTHAYSWLLVVPCLLYKFLSSQRLSHMCPSFLHSFLWSASFRHMQWNTQKPPNMQACIHLPSVARSRAWRRSMHVQVYDTLASKLFLKHEHNIALLSSVLEARYALLSSKSTDHHAQIWSHQTNTYPYHQVWTHSQTRRKSK